MKKTLLILIATLTLLGCSQMKINDFKDQKPELKLFEYFTGKTNAWGIFEDRFGNLRRQFKVKIDGYIEDDKLVLEEYFEYFDGEKDKRVWKIKKLNNGFYEGSAGDVVGTAKGQEVGNAFTWTYDVDLKIGTRNLRVNFNDWMFRMDEKVIVNKASVSKFGINIGTVTLFFMKED